MPRKNLPERKLGDRMVAFVERSDGTCSLLIHELKEHNGQRWNVIVGELNLENEAKAKEVAIWIR